MILSLIVLIANRNMIGKSEDFAYMDLSLILLMMAMVFFTWRHRAFLKSLGEEDWDLPTKEGEITFSQSSLNAAISAVAALVMLVIYL